MDVPSPPSASALGAPATSPASAPTVAIRNVLVILPSITRGFQPKNYNPPAYANIGRSPSLPTADMFFAHLKGSQADRLAKPRLSIAYGHAASLAPKQPLSGSPLQMRMMEGERLAEDLAGSDGDTTPPYPVSSGHLSPAARQEITAQLANPITPNSLPTDARRQSISTLLPAGVMSAKLSQLILEEEEANIRMEQARNSALGTTSSPTAFNTPYSMGGGRPETISEGAGEAESTSASAAGTTQSKRRPFPLARSTSNSASVSPSPSQLSPLHSTTPSPSTASANTPAPRTARRTRSRPQTSAAALNSAPVPAFGAKSNKLNASATSSSGSGSASGTTLAGSSKASEAMRPKRAVVSGAPGWEGEEIVNILREDGIQVSTLRTASQLGQFIDHIHSLPMSTTSSDANSTGGTPAKVAQIIMVPLSDSPTLPSLSLLLTQGTTPSAICFQQDLLDRARRTEADWLPSALHIIGEAMEQSLARVPFGQLEETTGTSTKPMTYVIAYSANPALSQSVVARCLQAGAIGVLQPPYENRETLALIKKMIASEDATHTARRWAIADATRRASIVSAGSALSPDKVPPLPIQQPKRPIPILPLMPLSQSSKPTEKDAADTPSPFISDLAARRRSVDTGGLSLALQRASRHIMEYERHDGSSGTEDIDASKHHGGWRVGPFREARTTNNSPQQSSSLGQHSKTKTDRSASVADVGSHFAPASDDSNTIPGIGEEEEMAVAELLSEMYRQTRVAIEIQMEDYDSFAAPISPEHRERLIRSLAGWDFKPHMLSDEDLFHCACLLFEAVLSIHGLSELGVEQDQLHRLLFAIRAIYHAPNPYHNYVHAVDVVQATYTFLVANGVAPPVTYLLGDNPEPWTRQALEESDSEEHDNTRLALYSLLRPQDILTIMIGAMGHDVGHPGLSNVFMKNAKTPLSQIYSDKSVLENMHCILVVQLLRKHGFGFLLTGANKPTAETGLVVEFNVASSTDTSPMSDIFPNIVPASAAHRSFKRNVRPGAVGDWRGFKKLLYATVLSTDMSLHFEWLKRFKEFGKRARAGFCVDLPDPAESEARTLLCQALIKCADISNPTRPIEVSEYWSTVLLDEWAVQASLEQKLNLPISVVASADAVIQAKGQIGFIDLFTLPLYEAAADAMPDLRPFTDQCIANRALWQARFDTLKELTGDPLPIARTLIAEQKLPAGTTPEDRYKLLFPLSIPASLLDDDDDDEVGASPDIHVQSAASSINSQSNTPSVASTPYSPSRTESTTTTSQKPTAANCELRALRAAYRASINKRHSPHSFHRHRHQQQPTTTTTSSSSTTPGTNEESSFPRDPTQ